MLDPPAIADVCRSRSFASRSSLLLPLAHAWAHAWATDGQARAWVGGWTRAVPCLRRWPKPNYMQAPGHTPNQTPGHTPNQTPGHTPNQTPGHTPNQTPGHTSNQTPGHMRARAGP
eukprot:364372-Chlamydomonas_euryale.AAC.15